MFAKSMASWAVAAYAACPAGFADAYELLKPMRDNRRGMSTPTSMVTNKELKMSAISAAARLCCLRTTERAGNERRDQRQRDQDEEARSDHPDAAGLVQSTPPPIAVLHGAPV